MAQRHLASCSCGKVAGPLPAKVPQCQIDAGGEEMRAIHRGLQTHVPRASETRDNFASDASSLQIREL